MCPFCAIAESISSTLGCGVVLSLDVNLQGQHLPLSTDGWCEPETLQLQDEFTVNGKKNDERNNKCGSVMCCTVVSSFMCSYFICGCYVDMGHRMTCTQFVDAYWSPINGWGQWSGKKNSDRVSSVSRPEPCHQNAKFLLEIRNDIWWLHKSTVIFCHSFLRGAQFRGLGLQLTNQDCSDTSGHLWWTILWLSL